MTADFDILRSRLDSERKRLLEELQHLQATNKPSEERREGNPFGKREEEATEAFETEKRLAMERRLKDQLSDIERALRKFEEGNYGLCDSCDRPIEPARLEALPQANQCLTCKAKNAKASKSPSA